MNRNTPLDTYTLSQIHSSLQAVVRKEDWKDSLDTLLALFRNEFVYDNVAIYILDAQASGLDVVYARAVGRGKHAEADASWGEGIAGHVLEKKEIIIEKPHAHGDTTRLDLPHLIGLPLQIGGRLSAALVFVRFEGPVYTTEHIRLASLISLWTASLLERKALQEARVESSPFSVKCACRTISFRRSLTNFARRWALSRGIVPACFVRIQPGTRKQRASFNHH